MEITHFQKKNNIKTVRSSRLNNVYHKTANAWSQLIVKNKIYAAITSVAITISVFASVDALTKMQKFEYDDDQFVKAKYSAMPTFIAKTREENLVSVTEQFIFTDCLRFDSIPFLNMLSTKDGGSVEKFFTYLSSQNVVFLVNNDNWLSLYKKWITDFRCTLNVNQESQNSTMLDFTLMHTFLNLILNKSERVHELEGCPIYKAGVSEMVHIDENSKVSAFISNGITKELTNFKDIVIHYKQVTKVTEVLSQSLKNWTTDKCYKNDVPPVFAYQALHFLADSFIDIEQCYAILLIIPGLISIVLNLTINTKSIASSVMVSTAIASNLIIFGGLIYAFQFSVNPIMMSSIPFFVQLIVSMHESIWNIRRELDIEAFLVNDTKKLVFYLHRRAVIGFLIPMCFFTILLYFYETAIIQKFYQLFLCADLATIVTIILMQPRRTRKWRSSFNMKNPKS